MQEHFIVLSPAHGVLERVGAPVEGVGAVLAAPQLPVHLAKSRNAGKVSMQFGKCS